MATSQNVRFSEEVPADEEYEHPPGAWIATLLQTGLARRGWQVGELENWRDSGWSIACTMDESTLELVLATTGVGLEWLAQIVPTYVPGIIGRLLGKSASAPPAVVFALAKDVHALLAEQGRYSDFKWCWDAYPEEGTSTPQPVE